MNNINNETSITSGKAGMLAATGAVVTAILSSACCWLPLLLLAFGASAVGVSSWFEKYRLIFLGITALMLAGGFYLVYFKAPTCSAEGACCSTKGTGMRRFTKIMLWMSTIIVIVFAAFPNYVGFVIRASGPSGETNASTLVTLPKVSLDIEGMTCTGCAANLENSLKDLDGVAQAKVNYDTKKAEVWLKESESTGNSTTRDELLDTVAEAGFTAKVIEPGG